jgi:secreted PhoX family phosphatase
MPYTLDRRTFIARGAAVAGGGLLSTAALERLSVASASERKAHPAHNDSYGPLARVPDQRGVEVLALPAGFSYVTFSHSGSTMSDGNPTPLALDGMSAFSGRRHGEVRLVRNSEDRNPPGQGSVGGDPAAKYDPSGGGGTTTLVYDERRRCLVSDYISLNGTTVNCAGGRGFGLRSWITAEETVGGPEATDPEKLFEKRHGYLFEVPLSRGPGELEKGRPIRDAGRFSHEAVAIDQRHGIVYETEDPEPGRGAGFYRYLPRNPHKLTRGGRLQMLAVRDHPQLDMRQGQKVGRRLSVTWVDIDEPDPAYADLDDPGGVFLQGFAKGGALFNRLEGCWEDHGHIFFVSTSGGDAKNGDVNPDDGYAEGFGQIWQYRPRRLGGTLELVYESPGAAELDSPDNLTVTPGGGLIVCEDDASSEIVDTHPLAPGVENVNRVIGINRSGAAFEVAVNVLNGSELAGCCFSPSGRTLFFNIFGRAEFTEDPVEGMTCAVTGPWERGPL